MTRPDLRRGRLSLLATAALLPALFFSQRAFPADQRKEPTWHAIDIWQQQRGLTQNTVFALLQTSDGYLWVGTRGGLARFDGVRFTTFDSRDRNQLRENEVWALTEGDDASLWIGTYGGGVSRYRDGQFTIYTAREGLVNDFVTALCKDREGAIWIGTDQGVSRYRDGQFTSYTAKDGLADVSVRSLHADRDGNVWIGTTKGTLNRFRDGKVSPPVTRGPMPGSGIRSICHDREQALWFTSSNDGLFRLKGGKVTRFTRKDGLSSDRTFYVYEDPGGDLWVGTANGLDRHERGTSSFHNVAYQASAGQYVYAICSDREGSLWIGNRNLGLARLHRGQFISYTTKDGLVDDNVSTMLEDRQGNLWVGTSKGLHSFRGGKFTAYGARNGLPAALVVSLAEDRAGRLWVGTETGLYRSERGTGRTRGQPRPRFIPIRHDAIPGMQARVIYEDRAGTIWIGTNLEGLVRYRDNHFTTYTTRDGLSSNAVRALFEDRDGSLWIGTRGGGLNRLRDGKFTAWTEKDGLVNNSVQALYPDRDGAIWIATRLGMSRYRDGRFTTLTVNDGLYCDFVYSFAEDDKGNLWMTCSKGIFRASKQQLNDFADGKIRSVTSVAYGLEHGLSSTVGPVGYHPLSYKTSDGRVWFGMSGGLSVTDPEKLTTNTLPPPVHVQEVSIDQHAFAANRAAEARPGRGDITIRYTGLSFLAPEKVRFKYRLEGYDRDWVDAGDRRAAFYSNIPPGRYTFHVIAANNDGVWNEAGSSLTIFLAPHFHQTKWFYGLCILAAGVIVIGMHRLRIRRLKATEQQLAGLADQRTRELEGQRTFLRKVIDLNPSFIFARDRAGRFTLANRALADAYGTTVDDLIGKTMADFSSQQQEVEEFRRVDLEVLDSKTELFIPEEEFTDRDGHLHWLQVAKIPITADDQAEQVLGVATDITPQKQAAIAMQRAKEAAEAAARARSAFLANMSHELRTPLDAILGFARLLGERRGLPREAQEDLGVILRSGEHLHTLINQILDLSKIEAGRATLNETSFDLSRLLDDLKGLFALRADDKGLRLHFERPADLPRHIRADQLKLRQVLINLLGNAIKFTDAGGVTLRVTMQDESGRMKDERGETNGESGTIDQELHPSSFRLNFSVADTGCGIAPEELGNLFGVFVQAEAGRKAKEGTGLGLAISSNFVKLMGGEIRIESEPGRGTTVSFAIPAQVVGTDEGGPPRRRVAPPGRGAGPRPATPPHPRG